MNWLFFLIFSKFIKVTTTSLDSITTILHFFMVTLVQLIEMSLKGVNCWPCPYTSTDTLTPLIHLMLTLLKIEQYEWRNTMKHIFYVCPKPWPQKNFKKFRRKVKWTEILPRETSTMLPKIPSIFWSWAKWNETKVGPLKILWCWG